MRIVHSFDWRRRNAGVGVGRTGYYTAADVRRLGMGDVAAHRDRHSSNDPVLEHVESAADASMMACILL